ncbi:hypothetical protein PSPO01_01434 [Paraphaeosphaeria sporulosa]
MGVTNGEVEIRAGHDHGAKCKTGRRRVCMRPSRCSPRSGPPPRARTTPAENRRPGLSPSPMHAQARIAADASMMRAALPNPTSHVYAGPHLHFPSVRKLLSGTGGIS